MKTIEMAQATASLAEYARQSEALILTVNGKPIAALVPIENADWETVALSIDPQFLDLIERSRARHQTHSGSSSAEVLRQLGLQPPPG